MRQRALALLVLLLTLLILGSAAPVYAQGPEPPTPGPEEGTGEEGEPRPLETIVGAVTGVFHTMIFPVESMTAALRQSLEKILMGTFEGLADLYAEAMHAVAFGEYASGPGAGVVEPLWTKLLMVAVALWPLTLGLNVLAVARGGVAASAVGYADLKEAIIEWVASCVGAAISLYVLRWGVDLSNAVAGMLLPHDPWEIARGLGSALADTALIAVLAGLVPGGLIFMLIFTLTLGFAMMTAFLFSFIARYVILFALMSIAPLVLTMGAIPATRWLSWLWLKGVVLVLLLRPVNAVLLSLAFGATRGAVIVRLFVVAGILSILLTINYAVANAVFGAIGEIARKAKATTEQVMATAILALGAVAGGAAALGGLGALGAGAGTGAGGGAGGAGSAAAAEAASAGSSAGPSASPGAGETGAGSGSVAARVRSALGDPNTLRRLGKAASGFGRGLMYISRGPIGRAVGATIGGGGDLAADVGGQRALEQRDALRAAVAEEQQAARDERGALRDRYSGQHRALAGWGLNPRGEHFYDVADAMQRLEAGYGRDRVREFAAPAARMLAAAEGSGASLTDLARGAGFSSVGAWFGNRVEEGIQAKYGMGGAPLFPAGGGLRYPGGWAPGALTAYDFARGLELADTLGRTAHPNDVRAYAELVHAFRNPAARAGAEGVDALVEAARSINGQFVGQSGWKRWAPFADAAERMAQQYGVQISGPAATELEHLRSFQPPAEFLLE